ncbi:hypothetical protein [Psychrobacter sp. FDAARGOS_221]|uniref:hypothetical protein n=1 Tax=Psychrobacter sp. FDAARGOS_221 TaxID=1975705 RepID=UPI0029DE6A66|nr:hypothetical protein [Psychrobacter sp. FDAARGOS_221]
MSQALCPRELVARLKAIWRREQLTASATLDTQTQSQQETEPQQFVLESGIWRYEPMTYTLYWNDHKLELSNTERNYTGLISQSRSSV